MTEALQGQYPHIYLMIHGDPAARKGVTHSICPLIQDRS